MSEPNICESCEEEPVRYRLTLTDQNGIVVASRSYCSCCIVEAQVAGRGAALDLVP